MSRSRPRRFRLCAAELVSKEDIAAAHQRVIGAAGEVIKLRGYTSTAIGMAVGKIVEAILKDKRVIMPLSINAKGRCGIEQDVFLSLPCIVDRSGVRPWETTLPESESLKLQASAATMYEVSKEMLGLK